MEKTAWKVVIVGKDKKFKSTNSIHYCNTDLSKKYHLDYELNKETSPIIGKIFCFDTRDKARNYKKAFDYEDDFKATILKGIAKNLEKCTIPRILSISTFYNIKVFWTDVEIHKEKAVNYASWGTPNDTYLCDSFTPIKKVS